MASIKANIKCTNIAPIASIDKTIETSGLKLGVFANNGSGKTYLSRMFRLLENNQSFEPDETGSIFTDPYLSFDKNKGGFSFKVVNYDGVTVENASVIIEKGKAPQITSSFYTYHTFNQDYVDENIRALDYEKDSAIEGFILGKTNIDLSDDESRLDKIKTKGSEIRKEIQTTIDTKLAKISEVRDIRRLNEYKAISLENIVSKQYPEETELKSVDEYIADYNKVKSIPENINTINSIGELIEDNISFVDELSKDLQKCYTLSSYADDFKSYVKQEHAFIERGISIHNTMPNECPFCRRSLDETALSLIDKYNTFLNDSEAKTVRKFQDYLQTVHKIISQLKDRASESNRCSIKFDEYKSKYIPSFEKESLSIIDITEACGALDNVKNIITQKIENLEESYSLSQDMIDGILSSYTTISRLIITNNRLIASINDRLEKIAEESKEIRRSICKATAKEISLEQNNNIELLGQLRKDYMILKSEIEHKKETEKITRKTKVADTIKKVLGYFFDGKYSLDENTFRLTFNTRALEKGRVKHVLSEGEKNIIAFAYYLGDTHLKVESEEDYNKVFFVIDDPISSMDFTHVYTISGVIRDINKIIDGLNGYNKLLILTHNNDFMRILTSNKILDKVFLLKNGDIKEFNENYTVPYISHLLDVYRIARKGEKATHTTANSIRHIIETLVKFTSIKTNDNSVKLYIEEKLPKDRTTYTYINDMSHGGWRSEQEPMDEQEYQEICETIIQHLEKEYPKQIAYCEDICKS